MLVDVVVMVMVEMMELVTVTVCVEATVVVVGGGVTVLTGVVVILEVRVKVNGSLNVLVDVDACWTLDVPTFVMQTCWEKTEAAETTLLVHSKATKKADAAFMVDRI